eukprot:scpid96371/ scgid4994/ 
MGKAFLAQDLTVEDASLVPDTCWYARSPKIRSPRPAHIEFKVGQVVEFTTKGYRGIVFGWDAKPHLGYDYELQVPEKYVDQDENVDSPCYMVMCDSVDAGADCVTYYVPQDQLKPSTCAVRNSYFDHFFYDEYIVETQCFKLKDMLRNRYPLDW